MPSRWVMICSFGMQNCSTHILERPTGKYTVYTGEPESEPIPGKSFNAEDCTTTTSKTPLTGCSTRIGTDAESKGGPGIPPVVPDAAAEGALPEPPTIFM